MRPLDRMMLRTLWVMKGQALAIAMVIASGVATFIMSVSTLDSLRATRTAYYADYGFADAFASLKRAPEGLLPSVTAIPGIKLIESRVVANVKLQVPDFTDPVTGLIVSLPEDGQPMLNRLYIRMGRTVAPGREDEVVLNEAFAEAHGLTPGDTIKVVINGRKKSLKVVGVALSPEFIFQMSPGAMFPDFKHYGVLWMGRRPLSAAYNMEGAFNDLAVSFTEGASEADVIDRLDELLKPYGGLGAFGRENQISHRFLSDEFRGLEQMALWLPAIFLGVAAFLLSIVVARLIHTQREQAAVLKAFGYSGLAIGVHYAKLVGMVVLMGSAAGVAAGAWLGSGLSSIYMEYYKFPFIYYELKPSAAMTAVLISAVAALLGTIGSVRRAMKLPPAQAMRPEPPAKYKKSIIERSALIRKAVSQPGRMILRQMGRAPLKSLMSITGLALSSAILVVGGFFSDAVNFMAESHFGLIEREDISVTFTNPTSIRALNELRGIPGVLHVEPRRAVYARLRSGHRSYRTAIEGIAPGSSLYRVVGPDLRPMELPPSGMAVTAHLGGLLGVRPGDKITVEVLQGTKPVSQVVLSGFAGGYIGSLGYMPLAALNRLMREGDVVTGAHMDIDPLYEAEILDRFKAIPAVSGTVSRRHLIENFYETMSKQILLFAFFNTLLAGCIAFGVVYNTARISLSERSRELASLRVLGFTRAEASYVLLGELGLFTLLSLPLGFAMGYGLCSLMASALQTDLYRIPFVIGSSTYAFGAAVVLVSALCSGLIVRRRIDRLDLVGVLKTKE